MPIQLNYTDSDTGINIPASYWFIISQDFDRLANVARWMFGCYNSLASKNAGKNPFRYREIITTLTSLGITGTTTANQIIAAMETFALNQADPETGIKFFNGGVIV